MPAASRSCDSCHDALTGIDSSEYYRIPPKPNHPRPTIPPIPHEFPPDHPLLTRAVIAQPNCHLLDLPLELRQKIHDRILAQDITVDLRLPKTKHTSPCSSWIQTCSQLYQECAEDYYRNLRFVIWAPVFPFPPNNNFVLAKRLRAIGAEFLEQQRRRPHMTPRRVWIVWGLIGDVRDNEHEDRNNRWIEARDLIWDYFYWAHHYIPNVRLMVVYEWFMADGRRAIFCDDTRERQLWQCAKYRDGGGVSETTLAERESMELWNRQLGQWSHGQSQSTRVQRLWERGMPLFPLEHPAGQGGDE
ncbi:unnamed protein product [Zymoseptoria tritici ST99CH_1A5]|uniref:F-box domain-containing protein n=1 Tax=Zymoseptoria tritici ST99CH_1A5 TaxID=1276529 RepID=A0A1Y6LL04_ZYMTR|nr:unnamed protein product [Zymoseptoria tritici ST99CH_1A5]